MPATQSNPLVRVGLTLAIIGAALGLVVFFFVQQASNKTTATQPTPPALTADESAPNADATTDPATTPATAEPPASTAQTPDAATTPPPAPSLNAPPSAFAARIIEDAPPLSPLGSLDPDSGFRLRAEFTLAGAGVQSITLANYFETIRDASRARHNPGSATGHYQLQSQVSDGGFALVSLAANNIEVNGQTLALFSQGGRPVWRETAPGSFVCEILDAATGATALRITREYTLAPDSFTISVRQRIENLTAAPVSIKWYQFGPVDLAEDPNANNTPTRRIRFGYTLTPQVDPTQATVRADTQLTDHNKVLKRILESGKPDLLWPNPAKFKDASGLSWVAQTSRYFAFAMHPAIAKDAAEANLKNPVQAPLDKRLPFGDQVWAHALGSGPTASLALEVVSPLQLINPGAALDLDFAAYAGPMSREILGARDNPVGRALSLSDMVVFQLGMCGFCAFQPIARVLLGTLRFFHSYVVFDWGLAIIMLVIVIRSILHPVFKRSQVSMMRFSRQMSRLAPKQKALQEKYKGDPKKLREEQVRLMREENVNYAGMLGCVPMFLQTPIWIALYAMLFFAFDLRHQPAFFGIFQKLTNANWMFLADLSRPDNFIPFGLAKPIPVPILGPVSSINILPLILGVVFFLHQKMITPPTTSQLSPEQEQAQKIAKWMMVVMFPLFMYNQSSALCLYFVTNSCVAILESHFIRKHADTLDLDAPTKPPGGRPPLGRKPVANTASNPFKKNRGETKRFKDRE